MTRSTESTHVLNSIPDYVLGLLPGDDAEMVAAHLAACGECHQAAVAEQQIGRAVKAALTRASTPEQTRLRRLMPPPPAARTRNRWPLTSPGLAAAAFMLLLIFGAMFLFSASRPGAWGLSAPTIHATAVLLTDTPTQTATREITVTAVGLEASASPIPVRPASASGQSVAPAPALAPAPAVSTFQ